MGLNVKDIQLWVCKVVQVSAKSSYTFLQRHPLISGALLVCFILYLFLSYIYSFLVYLSPFLVCAAIFVRIFWSSEKTELKYVKREAEKGEQERVGPKYPKIANNGRRDLLYKYPSQNATSRRRNFRGKKWDVYGGLEEKAKDLSTVFHNEFTKRNIDNNKVKFFEKGGSSLDYGFSAENFESPRRHTLTSEPSMIDLVELDTEKIEDGDDEDEEEAQEDGNKAIEWTEDDQKNLMDLGFSEMERNRRLESLIARRRARKLLKLQLDNGLIDKKSIAPPRHIAPLFIARNNPLDSPKDFEGLEMPGSAPSVMPRSPYDIPYDPYEEKPNLKGDNFDQEFICHQKDMAFCRHESFSLGPHFPLEPNQDHGAWEHPFFNIRRKYSDRLAYPRFRRLSDKGNHDWLIDQLLYNEGGESGFEANNPLRRGEETTHEEDEKCKTDMNDMKDEKVENVHETKPMSDHTSEPGLILNISKIETARVSKKTGPRFPKPHERLLNFPASNSTTVNEDSIPSPVDKKHDHMFFNDGRICHTPTYSIASDLQVEVSEVGSPASTVDENAMTNSTTDRDSVLYEGDIDRDVSSGSEDLWGASFHGREAQGVSREYITEVNNNSKDVASPIAPRQIDEENVADVSSFFSKSDMPDDTPTHVINSDHNIVGYMKYSVEETEAPQSSNSYVTSPQKRSIDSETNSKKPEEWINLSENLINEAQVINDVNNLAATVQDSTENSISNEDPSTSVARQESVDEASIYSVASSPRSVLPEKTIADEVLSSTYYQQMHIGSQQSNMENMAQEILNDERRPDTMPLNIYPLIDGTTNETHNVDFNHSQGHTNPPENSIEERNIFGKMNDAEVCNKEEQDKLNNDENDEENSTHQIRQEATAESSSLDEKSRELVDDKVPSNSPMIESSSEVHIEDKPKTSIKQEATVKPCVNAEADMENYSQSESKELVEDEMEKENLDKVNISKDSPQPMVTEATDSMSTEETVEKSDKVNNNETIEQQLNKNETMVASESVEERDKMSNTTHMKEPSELVQLEDVNAPKPYKPNDRPEAGYFEAEVDKNDKPTSGNAHEDLPQPTVIEPTTPSKETNEDS